MVTCFQGDRVQREQQVPLAGQAGGQPPGAVSAGRSVIVGGGEGESPGAGAGSARRVMVAAGDRTGGAGFCRWAAGAVFGSGSGAAVADGVSVLVGDGDAVRGPGFREAARARSRAKAGSTGPRPETSPGRSARPSMVARVTVRLMQPVNPAGSTLAVGGIPGSPGSGGDPPRGPSGPPPGQSARIRPVAARTFGPAVPGVPAGLPLPGSPLPGWSLPGWPLPGARFWLPVPSWVGGPRRGGGGAGVPAEHDVHVRQGPELVHVPVQARFLQLLRPPRDPLVRGQHVGGGQFPAHQRGVAGIFRPPLDPGVSPGFLAPLDRLVRARPQ